MEKIRGSKIILNGKSLNTQDLKITAESEIYYEVIRLVEESFIFLNDHLDRLLSSCLKAGINFKDIEAVRLNLRKLLEESEYKNGNCKVLVFAENEGFSVACYFIPHHYPTSKECLEGVRTKTFKYERPDPTVKRWNNSFRTSISMFIQKEEIYEALLLNENQEITEGSRSNLFFIDQKDQIITAPESLILPGITRKYVLEICKEHDIVYVEKVLTIEEAKAMKACFITGTSPKVLPVKSINQVNFDISCPVLSRIIEQYNGMIISQLKG